MKILAIVPHVPKTRFAYLKPYVIIKEPWDRKNPFFDTIKKDVLEIFRYS